MTSRPLQVSASILCANFSRLADEVKKCESAGVDLFHIDVMDGHFVPNISIGPVVIQALRPLTRLPIEAHLMIEHPGTYIEEFIAAGADIIGLHAECYGVRRASCRAWDQYPKEIDVLDEDQARRDIALVKKNAKKVFLVINPGTPLYLGPLLSEIDGVLIMSVNPGFARQKFMPEALARIRELRKNFHGSIAVDGGVNAQTAPDVVKAGVDILVTASYLFGAAQQGEAVHFLKSLARG